MRELKLILKRAYFDAILAGTKTEEYRDIKPTTMKKYVQFEVDGKVYKDLRDVPASYGDDFLFDYVPIKYDAIRFYAGYTADRDSMLVEVKGVEIVDYVDEEGNYITFDFKGDTFIFSQMVYSLGKIIETDIHPKN